MKAPFPWFGGKSRVADLVWDRLGDVPNYVEPFFGSGAVLLSRPADHTGRTETANDYDGYIANFWRALQHDPDAVTEYADHPVNENDLHARHAWLLQHRDSLRPKLEGDPDYYDAKIAGWWVWGICSWIGSGWCAGTGAWHSVGGRLVKAGPDGNARQMPFLNRPGAGVNSQGVHRQLVHLGNSQGVQRQLVHLGDTGRGVQRQLVHLGDTGRGVRRKLVHLGDRPAIAAGARHCGECREL
jgi:DNA adenine methylase